MSVIRNAEVSHVKRGGRRTQGLPRASAAGLSIYSSSTAFSTRAFSSAGADCPKKERNLSFSSTLHADAVQHKAHALRTPEQPAITQKIDFVHGTCHHVYNIAMGILHMIFGYGFLTYETGLRKPHTFLCTATGGWRLHRPVDRPRDLPCIRIDQDNAYILTMGLRREYSRRPRPFQKPVLAERRL